MNAVIIRNFFYFSGGDSNVVKTDYFSSIASVLFKNVIDFEVVDNYMFATNYVSASQYFVFWCFCLINYNDSSCFGFVLFFVLLMFLF